MMTSCPANERLQRLLDGGLSHEDESELTSHLETCEPCQRTLESLAAGTKLWSGAVRHLATADEARESALDNLIQQAKRSKTDAMQDDLSSNESISLEYLQPAEQPGILGRLDQYDVLETVGCGGMGIVHKGFDPSLRRIVAIKVMSPLLAANASARRRFVREAQAAAAVAHEHVVAIHAVADKNEPPYIVMQFIAGKTLQDRLDRSGPPQLREILRIGLQAAAGLAAAHAQGLVHRDIKPANILLENGIERVKLTDFGLARAVDDASVTQSGVIAGTPQYMSPEQARGEAVDHRSDLFSLGSVLYAMCVGHAPFRATTTMGVLKRLCDESARPIRELNPDIPDWMCDVITKLHAKNPHDRFQSADEVAELLAAHLAHLQQPTLVARPGAVPIAQRSAAVDLRVQSDSASAAVAAAWSQPDQISPDQISPDQIRKVQRSASYVTTERDGHDNAASAQPSWSIPWHAWIGLIPFAGIYVVALGDLQHEIPSEIAKSLALLLIAVASVYLVAYGGIAAIVGRARPRHSVSEPRPWRIVMFFGLLWFFTTLFVAKWAGDELIAAVQSRINKSPKPMPMASSAMIQELRELVSQCEADAAQIRTSYNAGSASVWEVHRAEQALLEVKIRLATAEGQTEQLPQLHDELVKLCESKVAIAEVHFEKGALPQLELSQARKELINARIQREAARQLARGRQASP